MSFDSGQQEIIHSDMTGSVAFEELGANDSIIIRTKNSLYRFRVNNAASRQGMLSGGSLGEGACNAVLVESLTEGMSFSTGRPKYLKIGARALFYLSSARGIERIRTSVITDLAVLKEDEDPTIVS